MNTSNTMILEAFFHVLTRKHLTKALYEDLIKRWNLESVNLDEELVKINNKKSHLTKSRRDAVPLFIKLRDVIKENEEAAKQAMDMKDVANSTLAGDQLTL